MDNFDAAESLAGLKDFQRRTVDYVFKRMWLDEHPATRFLVADEVGLGKTHVARGVVAKTLEHLRKDVKRIDVVYICSNAAIAQQNINKLNVLGDKQVAIASRLTLLPLVLHELDDNPVNFISFTPGTTFDLKSRGGTWKERVVLHRLLSEREPGIRRSLIRVLCGDVRPAEFRRRAKEDTAPLNRKLGDDFIEALRADDELYGRLHEACDRLSGRGRVSKEDRAWQFELIGALRNRLARVCVAALQPDLVILDEFQRFRDMLDGESEAAQLARSLMDYTTPERNEVRVLMLSATPYKPLTLSTDEEDHYRDFLRTLEFLFNDPARVATLEEHLRVYRRGLFTSNRNGDADVERARRAVETTLRSVMVRTERVGRTVGLDAMLITRVQEAVLAPSDLDEARLMDTVSATVGATDSVEYWKSAPYLLHFMKDYQIRRNLEETAHAVPEEVAAALRSHRRRLLSASMVNDYRELDPANGRLKVLMDEMVTPGQWQLLWVHPCLPYMQPGGAYSRVRDFTKALIFSSWTVVPDVIASICSYEAERLMLATGEDLPLYENLYTARRPLLRFAETRGRLTGMPALALMYPSIALARGVDPLTASLEAGGSEPAKVDDVKRYAAGRIEQLLVKTGLWPRVGDGPADQRWYWAAMAILDREYLRGLWPWLTAVSGWRYALKEGDEDSGLQKHIAQFASAAAGQFDDELGRTPDDLLEVLVELALGSPAICAARALFKIAPGLSIGDSNLSQAAAHVAGGFRTLFNLPESMALLRGAEDEAYWRLTLQHGIDGNLQAVLDEYAHQLRESLGLADHEPVEIADGVAGAMAEALSLRTAPVAADELIVSREGKLRFERFRFRTRFALRFGDLHDDQDKTLARVGTVRAAFNSPFRPFVLASTSVGQEGLDFHPYCHAVYHWNLPSNPVDLEQREGRVHRYKGHAVRKNVAQRWGLKTVAKPARRNLDPWEVLFSAAAADRPAGANELIPFWIYEIEGGARVERRVPQFPFSREVGKLDRLQRELAVYRLVFGQPRQEDLLTVLARLERDADSVVGPLSLEPPG
jgi:hypothetical protein